MDKDEEKFFYEDEVAMVSQKTGLVKYGLVLSTNRSRSECDLKKRSCKNSDEIKVIWHPHGTEEVIPDDKVVLMDRSLMPGDVVRKISKGKFSQFGYCENINIQATVKILNTNKIIENVSSQDLTPTKPFAIDSSVFYESWVGGVYDVKFKVTFASQDGSIFTLEDPYRQDFISLSTSDSFSVDDNVFYPGQKLKMCLDSLDNAKFLTISNLMNCLCYYNKKKYNYKFSSKWIKVYVKDITVTSVEVEWYCQTSSKTKPHERIWPERIITGDNLKKLKTVDLFESCSIQLGDTHWYTIKETDKLMTIKQWRSMCTETFTTGSESSLNTTKKNKRVIKHQSTKKPPKSGISSFEMESCNHLQNTIIRNVSGVQMQRIFCNNVKYDFGHIKPENKSMSTTGNSSKLTMKSNRLKRNRMWKSLVKKSKRFNVPKVTTKSNSKVVVEICKTKSMIDVIWQDGTKEKGVSSTDLYPVQNLDDLEFFPGDFVAEKNPPADVYGVIESVDHAERTACVQWFKVYPENPSLPNPIEKTDFSVYDLRDHPDFHFKSGSLIIHISPNTNPDINTFTAGQVLNAGPDGRVLVMWVNGEKTECWPQELFVVKLLDDDDDDDFSFHDGEFDDDDDHTHAVDDASSEDWTSSPGSSKSRDQETNEKCSKLLIQSLKQAVSGMKSFMDAVDRSKGLEMPDMVIQFKKSLEQIRIGYNFRSFLPTSKTRDLESSYMDLMDNITKMIEQSILKLENKEVETENNLEYKNLDSIIKLRKIVTDFMDKVNQIVKEPCTNSSNVVVTSEHCIKEGQHENINQFVDGANTDMTEVNEPKSLLPIYEIKHHPGGIQSTDTSKNAELVIIAKPEEAGVFDIVETLPDNSHKYMHDKENLHPSFLKIVHKDIQILQKSLPAGIWVKTFEDRMDLFCIMIRGPEKTPYAGGLFMFDVKIPSTYPQEPPLCHYFSFCDDRLNPNLYEDGKVCLSLLGTWSGHGVELWSPKDSNILQLLVSIQGLILVSEPYYNEAGFDTQRGQQLAKENSRVYNEMVLIKVVQSMTNMLTANFLRARAAIHFKEEIMEHVKCHGPKLINTIENWIQMSQRQLTEDEKLAPGYPLLPLSKGFCLSIKKALNSYKEILISMNVLFQ